MRRATSLCCIALAFAASCGREGEHTPPVVDDSETETETDTRADTGADTGFDLPEWVGPRCDLGRAGCEDGSCFTLPTPVGSVARIVFLEPDGALWLVDGRDSTWRVDATGGSVIDPAPVEVFLVDGEVVRGVREGRLVERRRDGAFEVVAGSPEGLVGGFGAALDDHWLLGSTGELLHAVGDTFEVDSTGWGDHLLAADARATDDAWFVAGSVGIHGEPPSGGVNHWDGAAWVTVLHADSQVYDLDLAPGSGAWAAAYDGLFDGTDGWSLAAEGNLSAVAVTSDGAAWAAYTGYPMGRWFDGAWSPIADAPLLGGRLVAEGEAVWMGTEDAPAPSGLVRFDADGVCGGGVIGGPSLALWGDIPVATYWRSISAVHERYSETRFAVRRDGVWEEWSLGAELMDFVPFVHDGVPWLRLNRQRTDCSPCPLGAVLLRLDDTDWTLQHRFDDETWVTAVASIDDGPLLVATYHLGELTGDPGYVYRLEDGVLTEELEAYHTGFATFVQHDGAIWASGTQHDANVAWRREADGTWTALPAPPGWIVAAEADGTLWAADLDVWRGDGETWEAVCPGTFPDVDGDGEGTPPRNVTATEEGVYIGNSDGLFLWDGAALRRVVDAPSDWVVVAGDTLWTVSELGLQEGPLPPPGDEVPCLD